MTSLVRVALLLALAPAVTGGFVAPVSGSERQEKSYLRPGERIVFYGDSITEQGRYTRPIELYLAARHPEMGVAFVNSGWGGDRAWGGEGGAIEERLKRDVLAYKPTLVTVLLGMNDGYYTNFDQKALDHFKQSITTLVESLRREAPDVRITLIGTSPYDNVTPGERPDWEVKIDGGYDSVIAHYSQAMAEIARDEGLLFVDFHEPLVSLLNELQRSRPELARDLIPDRIHPGSAAGLVMAAELLKAWEVPASDDPPPIEAKGMDEAPLIVGQSWPTPFPLDERDPLTGYLLKQHGLLKVFYPPRLRVVDLPTEEVSLRVDGLDLGDFSATELEAGVELSHDRLADPTADALATLIDVRNRLHFLKWRTLRAAGKLPTEEAKRAEAELAALGDEVSKLQAALAKPAAHVIEIRRADP